MPSVDVCVSGRKRSISVWSERRRGTSIVFFQTHPLSDITVGGSSSIPVFVLQGDQGLQGPPGPFEYVDPPEDLYIKGEQVGFSVALHCSCEGDQGH